MEMRKILIEVIGLLTLLALWPAVVSGAARPPSCEEIETDVWLTATCEDAIAGIRNLSDIAGVEIVKVLVDGEVVFHPSVELQPGEMIERSFNWAELGVPTPIAEPHTIVIKTNDDRASITVGPCVEPTTLSLEPDEATNQLPLDTTHPFTAMVLDQEGEPVPGVAVSFSTTLGHFEGDDQYVEIPTDESGQAGVTVTLIVTGTAEIRAWIDSNGDGDYDEDEGELTDDPSTKTWTGEGPTSLVVSKTVEAQWARAYTWDVSKSVQPGSLALFQGQSHVLTYTIEARRDVVSDSYAVQGIVSVMNEGVNPAHLVKARDCVGYADPPPGSLITSTCQALPVGDIIPPGETAVWDYYSPVFTPVITHSAYYNRVEVTISNHYDGEHVFVYTKTFELPDQPTSERDACVTVTDEQTIPDGFSVLGDFDKDGQLVCDSNTFTITKTLTNVSAERGDYALLNTATITQADSGITVSDSATVTLTALEPCLSIHKILEGTYTNPEDGSSLSKPIEYIHISATWPTDFRMTFQVRNCGNVTLTNVKVTDSIETMACPGAIKMFRDEPPPDELRLSGDEPGLETTWDTGALSWTFSRSGENANECGKITWNIGDLSAGQTMSWRRDLETLRNSGGLYEPTLPDQSIKVNTGATVWATTDPEFGNGIAKTEGIILTLLPITKDPPIISEILELPRYETPPAEAVFTSITRVADAWVQKTGRNARFANGQVFKARDRFQVHHRR
jgi:hypothetical protein